jgi:hypothetical protein
MEHHQHFVFRDPSQTRAKTHVNGSAKAARINSAFVALNAPTLRCDRQTGARMATFAGVMVLALILGALVAMAQLTYAAMPDILAASAARSAW